MSQIYMKCKEYDPNTHSILIAFASDETKNQDPEFYGFLNYQPYFMFPDITNLEEMKERLIRIGISVVTEIIKKESLSENVNYTQDMENISNKTFTYNIEDNNIQLVEVVNNEIVEPIANSTAT